MQVSGRQHREVLYRLFIITGRDDGGIHYRGEVRASWGEFPCQSLKLAYTGMGCVFYAKARGVIQ